MWPHRQQIDTASGQDIDSFLPEAESLIVA